MHKSTLVESKKAFGNLSEESEDLLRMLEKMERENEIGVRVERMSRGMLNLWML